MHFPKNQLTIDQLGGDARNRIGRLVRLDQAERDNRARVAQRDRLAANQCERSIEYFLVPGSRFPAPDADENQNGEKHPLQNACPSEMCRTFERCE